MLKLSDKLTAEKVDGILAHLLPDEKSAKRRMNRLESFIFARAQEQRAWFENYYLSKGKQVSEEELDKIESQEIAISHAVLFEFEVSLKINDRHNSPEETEARIMKNMPGRWIARFTQNRISRFSRNVSGAIYDSVMARLKEKSETITSRKLADEVSFILTWHPEVEDGDRVSECRWAEDIGDWDLVVVKRDGQIIGTPTKTLEDVLIEGIVSKSRTVGVSGRTLEISDPFLGILVA